MHRPLASVVLPVHNGSPHLVNALKSLNAQTYSNIEVVIVDDGSTDDTKDVIDSYRPPNTIVIRQENQGVGFSTNIGIARSSGEYIVLHSSDDVSYPGRVEQQILSLTSQVGVISACIPVIIDQNGTMIKPGSKTIFNSIDQSISADDAFMRFYFHGNFICASTVAFQKSIWRRLGHVHPGLMQIQDLEFWLRAAASNYSFNVEKSPWVEYRWHESNISSEKNHARTEREMRYLHRQLIHSVSNRLSRLLLSKYQKAVFNDPSVLSSRIIMPFVAVQHPSLVVREVGLESLIHLMSSERDMELIFRQTGLNRPRLMSALLKQH